MHLRLLNYVAQFAILYMIAKARQGNTQTESRLKGYGFGGLRVKGLGLSYDIGLRVKGLGLNYDVAVRVKDFRIVR